MSENSRLVKSEKGLDYFVNDKDEFIDWDTSNLPPVDNIVFLKNQNQLLHNELNILRHNISIINNERIKYKNGLILTIRQRDDCSEELRKLQKSKGGRKKRRKSIFKKKTRKRKKKSNK